MLSMIEVKQIELLYKGKFRKYYLDESCTPPLYRLLDFDNGIEIFFHAEYRYGMYFKIKSVSYNGKTYEAERYKTKFIPLIREASFWIWKKKGLYDYGKNEFVGYHEEPRHKPETMAQFLGRKLLPRM